MQRPQRETVGKVLLLGVMLPATGVLVVLALRNSTPADAVTAGRQSAVTQALVISGGTLTQPVAARAGQSIGWQVDAVSHQGAGIARAPAGARALAAAVREDRIDPSVDMIVVQGGEGDTAAPQRELEVATYHLLDWLLAYKPANAIVVLAGPVPPPGGPSAELLRINHTLRFAARQRQVRYLDAFALKWTTGRDLAGELGGQLVAAQKPRTFASPLPEASPSPSTPTPSPTTLATPSP